MAKIKKKIDKEFKLSSWAINNKTTIYVLMFVISLSRHIVAILAKCQEKIFLR